MAGERTHLLDKFALKVKGIRQEDNIIFYHIAVGVIRRNGIKSRWCIVRRFSDFVELIKRLKTLGPPNAIPNSPPKNYLPGSFQAARWFSGNLNESFLKSRQLALEFYLRGLSHMYSDYENVSELQRNEIHAFFIRQRRNMQEVRNLTDFSPSAGPTDTAALEEEILSFLVLDDEEDLITVNTSDIE